jgi:hypothetical protein
MAVTDTSFRQNAVTEFLIKVKGKVDRVFLTEHHAIKA